MNFAMNDVLLTRMATDMRLFRYSNESKEHFTSRVVFSGMSLWMRAVALDEKRIDCNEQDTVSKKYHTERSAFILNEFIKFFPEVKQWFFDKSSERDQLFPIKDIQYRLLVNNELAEHEFTNRIIVYKQAPVKISKTHVWVKGLNHDIQPQYNGIAMIADINANIYAEENVEIDSLNLLEKCIISSNFESYNWNREKEYYNTSVRTSTFYESWQSKKPAQEYYISRIELGIKKYRYFIETVKKDVTFSSKIDDYIVESGNLRRLLLALRHKAQNPLSVTIINLKDHFELKMYVKTLPIPEWNIICALGWPKDSISNNQHICYNYTVLTTIKKQLKNLLIKIEEVSHE
jgi:hypothetical protein